jgi:hypothetical protein
MPMPVSRTSSVSPIAPVGQRLVVQRHVDAAGLGELHGIADQVEQHLAQPARIAPQQRGSPGAMQLQCQALVLARTCHQRDDLVARCGPGRSRPLQLHAAGLDLRHVEDVVDHAEQQLCPELRISSA